MSRTIIQKLNQKSRLLLSATTLNRVGFTISMLLLARRDVFTTLIPVMVLLSLDRITETIVVSAAVRVSRQVCRESA